MIAPSHTMWLLQKILLAKQLATSDNLGNSNSKNMELWFAVSIRWTCMINRRCHGSSYHSDQIETYSWTNTYEPFFFKSLKHTIGNRRNMCIFPPLSKNGFLSVVARLRRQSGGLSFLDWTLVRHVKAVKQPLRSSRSSRDSGPSGREQVPR